MWSDDVMRNSFGRPAEPIGWIAFVPSAVPNSRCCATKIQQRRSKMLWHYYFRSAVKFFLDRNGLPFQRRTGADGRHDIIGGVTKFICQFKAQKPSVLPAVFCVP